MHNVIILGTGRSGTSMVASLFRNSGAYMGERLIAPTPANPYGYYEDSQLNGLNNWLITSMLNRPLLDRLVQPRLGPAAHRDSRAYWLAAPRRLRQIGLAPMQRTGMETYAAQQPFCYKDPRFCATLPLWRQFLPTHTRYLVVFRDPDRTVDSMLRDAQETYDPPLAITPRWCYLAWLRSYSRLLENFSRDGQWLFVEYDRVLRADAIPAMEAFADTRLDCSQLDSSVSRSKARPADALPEVAACHRLYRELCRRADQDMRLDRRRSVHHAA